MSEKRDSFQDTSLEDHIISRMFKRELGPTIRKIEEIERLNAVIAKQKLLEIAEKEKQLCMDLRGYENKYVATRDHKIVADAWNIGQLQEVIKELGLRVDSIIRVQPDEMAFFAKNDGGNTDLPVQELALS